MLRNTNIYHIPDRDIGSDISEDREDIHEEAVDIAEDQEDIHEEAEEIRDDREDIAGIIATLGTIVDAIAALSEKQDRIEAAVSAFVDSGAVINDGGSGEIELDAPAAEIDLFDDLDLDLDKI